MSSYTQRFAIPLIHHYKCAGTKNENGTGTKNENGNRTGTGTEKGVQCPGVEQDHRSRPRTHDDGLRTSSVDSVA